MTAIHWLRENHLERSPYRVLVVDTETRPEDPTDPDRQTLRLWSARLRRRHGIDPRQPRTVDYRGHTALELAELVESLARADHTLWTFTHNLSFDLAVTALPVVLADRGWRVTEGALTTDNPWLRLRRRSHRLTVADSWSYLPASVESIGELVRFPKLELPSFDDDDAAWYARCDRDVAIVDRGLDQLMSWWDDGRYGNWSVTGPATGWSSYRHQRPAPAVLIDPDPAARTLEARAVTGGRRQVWQLGELPRGLYADLDLTTAHLTVMSERLLPMKRIRPIAGMALDDRRLDSPIMDVLAECELETATPRYPWSSGRGVFYPVGRFRTVLAGPEIRAARARGELRSIGDGYLYLLGDHMRPWARWLSGLLDPAQTKVPPAVRLAAKSWSRSIPGKWAGHTSEVIERIPDPRPGWAVEHGILMSTGQPADFLRIGGEQWTIVRDLWADDAFPAILAWIQSYTRLALGALIDRVGPAAIACNTDGVLVDVARVTGADDVELGAWGMTERQRLVALDWLCADWSELVAPFTVRIKTAGRRVTVLSPQHLIIDEERRLSGIPPRAVNLGEGRFAFTAWPKLRVQIAHDERPGFRTQQRVATLGSIPPTGWLLANGAVRPITLEDRRILPPGSGWPDEPGPTAAELEPSARQHPVLRAVLAGAR